MANSDLFVEHALDLVSLVGPVQARRMFGGHGLYHRGAFFALLDDDELFLKTDDETRTRFLEAGCRAWRYGGEDSRSYYRPPDDAHEDAEAMLPWARLAVDAALRAARAKAEQARAKEERRTPREAAARKKARRPRPSPRRAPPAPRRKRGKA